MKNFIKSFISIILRTKKEWGYFVCEEVFADGKTELWFSRKTRRLHRNDGPAKIIRTGGVVVLEHYHHGKRIGTGGWGSASCGLKESPHNSVMQILSEPPISDASPKEFIATGIDGIRRRYRVVFGGYEEIPMRYEDI